MNALLVALLLASSQTRAADGELPQPLRMMLAAREKLPPARFDWYVTEDTHRPDRNFHYTAAYAKNGDLLINATGDQDGWVHYDSCGPQSRFPMKYMRNAEGNWAYALTTISVDNWKPGRGDPPPEEIATRDIRWIGLSPFPARAPQSGVEPAWPMSLPEPQRWASGLPDCKWSESRSGERVVVRAEFPHERSVTWTLEADKGMNPSRIVAEGMDEQTIECEISLRQVGEHWFPELVSYRVNGKPFQTHRVTSIAIDPHAAAAFGLADLGAEPGFNVAERCPGAETEIWDGERIASLSEWTELVTSGKRTPGPTVAERARNPHRDNPYWTDEQRAAWHRQHDRTFRPEPRAQGPMGPWLKYTLEFIDRFRLDAEQRQKAMLVLRECEELGRKHLGKIEKELDAGQRDVEAQTKAGRNEAAAAAREKVTQLLKPLDEIFEKRLVPRLDELPTRAQREKALPPSSRPAPASAASQPSVP